MLLLPEFLETFWAWVGGSEALLVHGVKLWICEESEAFSLFTCPALNVHNDALFLRTAVRKVTQRH